MKTYNIIWFDDEYESLEILKEKATINGINHKGFSDAESGLAELERNLLWYDAIIVDGLFINKISEAVGESALISVARTIDRLANKKKIPWFILSGQPSFTKERNKIADVYKEGKVYDKTNDNDLNELWNLLKEEADKQIETQLRHDHSVAFEVCTSSYIGEAASKNLLEILQKETALNFFSDPEVYFTPLRKIIEDLFKAFVKKGLLPTVFVQGDRVSMNEASKFLNGSAEKGYRIISNDFPGQVIANNIRNVVTMCQPAAHRTEVDRFLRKINTPYLLLSTTYQLLDILVWFKQFTDNISGAESFNCLYKVVDDVSNNEIITGIIEQDENRNYHCRDCLLGYKYVQENFRLGDKIKILNWTENTNEKTKILYPKFASKFGKND